MYRRRGLADQTHAALLRRMRIMTAASLSHAPFGFAMSLWRSLKKELFDGYRPERHYMRGPGPKWRAKHVSRAA
jgi:hypothetical protein